MSKAELRLTLGRLQGDLDTGVLNFTKLDWDEAWAEADRLTDRFARATQCRTLDVLHIAVALTLKIKFLATTDLRQKALARKAGLKVLTIS